MEVILRHHTPIQLLVEAIRTCWDSGDKSDSNYDGMRFILGPKDKKLIQTVITKNHTSTLEHITYNFKINGISRLVLQELARHRIASLSVKSTRYTLSELKDEEEFNPISPEDYDRAMKYINPSGNSEVDYRSIVALENVRQMVSRGIQNDIVKYCLPENYKVDLVWSINARSLQNFLSLRSVSAAHFEIRAMAHYVFDVIPEDHKFLYDGKIDR